MTSRSLPTRVSLLVAAVGLLVAAASAGFSAAASRDLLRRELVKRGTYIAGNLAHNSQFGVMTEDRLLLSAPIEAAMRAEAPGESGVRSAGRAGLAADAGDVVSVTVRDARGTALATFGPALESGPTGAPRQAEHREARTAAGEPVLAFRAAVRLSRAAVDPARPGGADESPAGWAEVAIADERTARDALAALRRDVAAVALLFAALGAFAAWYLTGRWLRSAATGSPGELVE